MRHISPTKLARAWTWARRHVKWGAILGAVAAIICHFLPPHYRGICDAIAACLP